MDLKVFFQKIRETEDSIAEPAVVTVSLSTPDGGKAGVFTEVPRLVAARAIVENRARLATEEESLEHRAGVAAALAAFEERRLAGQARFSVIAESDLKALRSPAKPAK